MTVEEQIQKRDEQLAKEETKALQDNFTELLERYAPFFKWLHENRCIDFSPPGFEREPVNRRLRFYVRKKLPMSELKQDWNELYQIYQYQRAMFINIPTEKHVQIPDRIQGWKTEVVEKP